MKNSNKNFFATFAALIKNKKFVTLLMSFLFAVIITASLSPLAVFAQTQGKELSDTVSIEECEQAAKIWLSRNYTDDTQTDEIIPIMAGDKVMSYCVNFKNSSGPNGYVVFDAYRYTTEIVSEFALSGKGIYDTLYANAGITEVTPYTSGTSTANVEKVIYSLGAYEYAVSENNSGSKFYTSYGTSISSTDINEIGEDVKAVKENTLISPLIDTDYRDNMVWGNTLYGTFESKTISDADSFIPSTSDDYRPINGCENNCGPTAAANILNFYREKKGFSNLGSSRQSVYDKIIGASGWNEYGKERTTASEMKEAMNKVVKSAGYKFYRDTYLYDKWSTWKRDLDKDHPVYTSFRGYRNDDYGNRVKKGHAVVAVGYREYSNGLNYLRIFDGWYSTNDRYLLFNSSTITGKDGVHVYCYK